MPYGRSVLATGHCRDTTVAKSPSTRLRPQPTIRVADFQRPPACQHFVTTSYSPTPQPSTMIHQTQTLCIESSILKPNLKPQPRNRKLHS